MIRMRSLFLFLVLLVCTGCVTEDLPDGKSLVNVGDSLPQFEITMNDGSVMRTEDLAGRPSLIVLFTTKCPDCRAELPVIQRIMDNFPELGIVCIAREEDESDIDGYWRENNLTLPYSPQSDRRVYNLFATAVVPRTYVANSSLVVIASFGDADIPTYDELSDIIERL